MAIQIPQAAYDLLVRDHGQALYDVSQWVRTRDDAQNAANEAQARLDGLARLLTQVEVDNSSTGTGNN